MSIDRRHMRRLDRLASTGRSVLTAKGQTDARTCDRKSQFPTKAKAKEHAALMTRRYGKKTWAYECPTCRRWHLTTRDPAEYRAEQRAGPR